jgi:hypothetical protein
MTIKCHEFFGCKEHECPMLIDGDGRNCWAVKPAMTFCINKTAKPASLEDKQVFCKNCLYYIHRHRTEE